MEGALGNPRSRKPAKKGAQSHFKTGGDARGDCRSTSTIIDASRRYRARRDSFVATERNPSVEQHYPTRTTKVYKRRHEVDLVTRHTYIHFVHDAPYQCQGEGYLYTVQRVGQKLKLVPHVHEVSSDGDN